jgi:uncharacterized protein DUF2505
MAEVHLRHEIDCDEDTFWDKCVFSEEFNRRLYLDTLKFPGFKQLDQTDEPTRRTRKVHIDPPLTGMPGPVKKLLGDRFAYVEDGVWDRATKKYTFKITPNILSEKSRSTGELYCEKIGDKKILRIATIKVEVKVFAVGSLIEDKIVNDLKASYEAAAKFTNEFVKEKGY